MPGPHDIAELVRNHDPGPDARSHGVAIEALGAGRPMWPRSEFDPGHFTASAFIASPDRSEVLLVRHARLGRWLQPGGHIEPTDRTVEAAARREAAEETAIEALTPVGEGLLRIDAHDIPAHATEPAHVHIDLAFGFVARSAEVSALDGVDDIRWVPFEELDAWDTDEAVRRAAAALSRLCGRPDEAGPSTSGPRRDVRSDRG